MKAGIIYNTEKERAVRFYEFFSVEIVKRNIEIVSSENFESASFFVVIGGDGTLLRAAKIISGYEKPVIAVNMGSLGFLTDVKEGEAIEMLERVICGDYKCEKRYMLRLSLNGHEYYALNDIVITRSSHLARMVRIKAHDGGDYINTYSADGVIISTPAGSTAYNLSAGGPILKPDLDAMVVTPIAPHTLSARPIVMSGRNVLSLESDPASGVVQIMIDGQTSVEFTHGDIAQVAMSEKKIRLVSYPNRSYYALLREKLKWGDALF